MELNNSKVLLAASNVAHSFDYLLFENVDLSICEGESVAIIGVSGSGKSTLLHILATLLKPKRGKVIYDQSYMYEQSSDRLIEIRRDEIGIIFQSHYLFKGFSAKENLDISSIISNKKIDIEMLKKLKIEKYLHQNVSSLSGGQQQRVSIARVLTKKPKIIFADEPTGNLDKNTADDVMNVMFDYIQKNRGGLFLVTHDEELAKKCDRVYRLKDKRLIPLIM